MYSKRLVLSVLAVEMTFASLVGCAEQDPSSADLAAPSGSWNVEDNSLDGVFAWKEGLVAGVPSDWLVGQGHSPAHRPLPESGVGRTMFGAVREDPAALVIVCADRLADQGSPSIWLSTPLSLFVPDQEAVELRVDGLLVGTATFVGDITSGTSVWLDDGTLKLQADLTGYRHDLSVGSELVVKIRSEGQFYRYFLAKVSLDGFAEHSAAMERGCPE